LDILYSTILLFLEVGFSISHYVQQAHIFHISYKITRETIHGI